LEIARREFLAKGYAGTTMDAVAASARISKNSLYKQYASKDLLYAAVVSDWVDLGRDAMRPHADALLAASNPLDQLGRLARTLQAAVLDPSVRQMRTLVAAEARQFPDVAADYLARSWGRNVQILADAFAVLAERGTISTQAPLVAAEQFTWLVVAAPLNRMTLDGGAHRYTQSELDDIADEALATFVARFVPPRPPAQHRARRIGTQARHPVVQPPTQRLPSGPAGTSHPNTSDEGADDMSAADKMKNLAEDLEGKAKEAAGRATDDRDLQAEGEADQTSSDLKQAGEKVKDAFKN
jgi:TetR/AcrR family transcriptional repressor of mexJK operon